jgi:hypothetical protein
VIYCNFIFCNFITMRVCNDYNLSINMSMLQYYTYHSLYRFNLYHCCSALVSTLSYQYCWRVPFCCRNFLPTSLLYISLLLENVKSHTRLALLENIQKALLPTGKKQKKTYAHTRLTLLENVYETAFVTVVKVGWKRKPFA